MADLAQLAASLKDNEAFQQALKQQRDGALEHLSTMPRSDEQAFYAAQAIVAVVDGINLDLEHFIRSGKTPKPPGIA